MRRTVIINLLIVIFAFLGLWYWLSFRQHLFDVSPQSTTNEQESSLDNSFSEDPQNSTQVNSQLGSTNPTSSPSVISSPTNPPVVLNNNLIEDDSSDMATKIKESFSTKYKRPLSAITVDILMSEDSFVKGSVDFDNSGNPAFFYAHNVGDNYVIVAVENGVVACSLIAGHNFPTSMIPECYSQSSGSVVTR